MIMRKKLFKIHSYCGLFALIPLIIVSITGSLLVFKIEIDQWLMPQKAALHYRFEHSAQKPARTTVDSIIKNVESSFPDYIIGSWELFYDAIESDRVYLIKKGTMDWYKIYVDPYANKILSQPVSIHNDITDWLLLLHYTFLLNNIGGENAQWGTFIGIFIALILTFLGISGLIIHRKFWKQLFSLRWRKKTRIFCGDLHRLVGAWTSPVMIILGFSGLYFNIIEYYHEVFEHAEEAHYYPVDKLYSGETNFQSLLNQSQLALTDFSPTYLVFPYEPDMQITVYGYQPDANPLASNYASTVSFNKINSDLINIYQGSEAALGLQLLDSFRALHFGSFGGLTVKIIWSIGGIAPAILGISGFIVWFKRK
jgi:uncharacterized iron-regulated membrane protein